MLSEINNVAAASGPLVQSACLGDAGQQKQLSHPAEACAFGGTFVEVIINVL